MKYFPPFELIRCAIEISTVRVELRVNGSYWDFVKMLRTMISGIKVNEAWYVKNYEDSVGAVREGIMRSARQRGPAV